MDVSTIKLTLGIGKAEFPMEKGSFTYIDHVPEKRELSEEAVRRIIQVERVTAGEASRLPGVCRSEETELSQDIDNNPTEEWCLRVIPEAIAEEPQVGDRTWNRFYLMSTT